MVEFRAFGKKPMGWEAWLDANPKKVKAQFKTEDFTEANKDYEAYLKEHFRLALLEAANVFKEWGDVLTCRKYKLSKSLQQRIEFENKFRRKYGIPFNGLEVDWMVEQLRLSAGCFPTKENEVKG